MKRFARALERAWYRPGAGWWPLRPLAWLFGRVVALRRAAYARGWLRSRRIGVPVLVIGNITVGGSGKTPLVILIVRLLQARGLCPGVVSRGYGGRAESYPQRVTAATSTAVAGDEPVLIARRAGVPVAVDPDRARAAATLVAEAGIDCVVADDGLQHYRLARDMEIAVTDARRGLGNRWLLPAGPLREPPGRLDIVDLSLLHGAGGDFELVPGAAHSLDDSRTLALADFVDRPVHAVAGIGDPTRFFDMLRGCGLTVIEHPMPDHHVYTARDLTFDDHGPVLMTEKDAVKCADLSADTHWYVPVDARLTEAGAARLERALARFAVSPGSAR